MHTLKLTLVVAVLCSALPPGAQAQPKPDAPTISADVRLREEAWDIHTLDDENPFHDRRFERLRLRLGATWHLAESLTLEGRMLWEGRRYRRPSRFEEWYSSQAFPDVSALRWTGPQGIPVEVVAGRQELRFGDSWLVMDATPLDGSRALSFDGLRFTWEPMPAIRLDLVGLWMRAEVDGLLPAIGGPTENSAEHDESGLIAWLEAKPSRTTTLSPYFILVRRDRIEGLLNPPTGAIRYPSNGDDATLYTPGIRLTWDIGAGFAFSGEIAGQWGRKNGCDVRGMGGQTSLSWKTGDRFGSRLKLAYEYLSGDDPESGTDETFDIVWGRFPHWSEYLAYATIPESRLSQFTNLQRLTLGYACIPWKPLTVSLDYHILFANEPVRKGLAGFAADGRFRGQALVLWLKYRLNKHLSAHLTAEGFLPGDVYTEPRNDPGTYLRAEIAVAF